MSVHLSMPKYDIIKKALDTMETNTKVIYEHLPKNSYNPYEVNKSITSIPVIDQTDDIFKSLPNFKGRMSFTSVTLQ